MEFIKKEKSGISYYSLDEFDKLGIKNMGIKFLYSTRHYSISIYNDSR